MTRLLKALGLMTRAEHDLIILKREDYEAKYNKAVTDLAAKSMALCDANSQLSAAEALLIEAENELASLRPDAEAMRAKRKRDRDTKAAKRGKGAAAVRLIGAKPPAGWHPDIDGGLA